MPPTALTPQSALIGAPPDHLLLCLAQGCVSHRLPGSDTKWCTLHEDQQARSLKMYKLLTERARPFDILEPELRTSVINLCEDGSRLREWHAMAEQKWRWKNRAYNARVRHHDQFYGGGDRKHLAFLDTLMDEMFVLENVMESCENRLYHLLTADAPWLRDSGPQSLDSDCSHAQDSSDDDTEIKPQLVMDTLPQMSYAEEPTPEDSVDNDEYYLPEDPEVVRRRHLLEHLLQFFDIDVIFQSNRGRSNRRLEVIYNLFRYVVARTPSLLVRARARNFPDVKTFLLEGDLSVRELEKLRKKLRFGRRSAVGPRTRRNAVADLYRNGMFRVSDPRGDGKISLLGGYVYEKPFLDPLPSEGWDLLHDFVPCAGCVISTCHSFYDWAELRRLSTNGRQYPWWMDRDEKSISVIALRALSVMVCVENADSLRSIGWVSEGGKYGRYEDAVQRPLVYMKMALNNPYARQYIRKLRTTFPAGTFVRNAATKKHLFEETPHIWPARSKYGDTKDLRFKVWQDGSWASDLFDALNIDSPETTRLGAPWADVWEVLIVDDLIDQKELPFRTFVEQLEQKGCLEVWNDFFERVVLALTGIPSFEQYAAMEEASYTEPYDEPYERQLYPVWPGGESRLRDAIPDPDLFDDNLEKKKKPKKKKRKKRANTMTIGEVVNDVRSSLG